MAYYSPDILRDINPYVEPEMQMMNSIYNNGFTIPEIKELIDVMNNYIGELTYDFSASNPTFYFGRNGFIYEITIYKHEFTLDPGIIVALGEGDMPAYRVGSSNKYSAYIKDILEVYPSREHKELSEDISVRMNVGSNISLLMDAVINQLHSDTSIGIEMYN